MPKKGEKMSEDQKAKIGAKSRSYAANPFVREERRQNALGHVVTEEMRQKIREARTGKPLSAEHIEKCREASLRLWQTEDYRAKIIEGVNRPEVREKLRQPAANAARSASRKAYWASKNKDERRVLTERLRKAGEEGRKARPTSIERAIARELDSMQIQYITQKKSGRFYVDIFVPEMRLAIECDGAYWHSRPERIIADREKDEWLRSQGYAVCRLLEVEIKADAKQATMRAIEAARYAP